ncbi:MAG: 50S ribosomal protein L1 [Bradymonadales bacterium]|nr:MAG: 50S ribosomal protein L1 [Bradymonadales bacterium]
MGQSAQNLETIEVIKKKHGKRFSQAVALVREKAPEPKTFEEVIEIILSTPAVKFDESLEAAFRLGVDPKQSDQMVRAAIVLPHGLGRAAKVVVFAKGAKEDEAKAAGADEVGGEELAQKILGGWTDFSSCVATPDMMPIVSKVARVLGPKGLMPNPKLGTVTMDLTKVISELKKGRVEYRVDKAGVVHAPFGKRSFGKDKLAENFKALAESIVRAKPSGAKGNYLLSIFVSSAMGPSLPVSITQVGSL